MAVVVAVGMVLDPMGLLKDMEVMEAMVVEVMVVVAMEAMVEVMVVVGTATADMASLDLTAPQLMMVVVEVRHMVADMSKELVLEPMALPRRLLPPTPMVRTRATLAQIARITLTAGETDSQVERGEIQFI